MKKIIFLFLVLILGSLFVGNLIAQEPTPDPVIIIPGIAGSWNWDVMLNRTATSSSGWFFMPTVKEYDNLIKSFEDKGYVRDQNLFVAFYDWRKGNLNSAFTYLVPVIDKALENSESGKVDIVAHSMGGIVARSYIQADGYRNDVDQLIMLGTPNFGSGDVYTLWEGGLIPRNWGTVQKNFLRSYLWYMTTATGQTADNYDTIHQHVPSIRELLPTYDYLKDKETDEIKSAFGMTEQNTFLNLLNWEMAIPTDRVRNVTVIAGKGESTVEYIPVVARAGSETKLWVDGLPEPNPPEKNSTGGDNRVLEHSAYLPTEWGEWSPVPVLVQERPFWRKLGELFFPRALAEEPPIRELNQITIPSKHGELPTTAISQVMEALGLGTPAASYTPPEEPTETLSFWFASPVMPEITDPSGKKISNTLSEISGAFYSGEENPQGVKMIVIPNPTNGNYTVKLQGNGDGNYHMGIGKFSDTADSPVITKEGNVETDQTIQYQVHYTPTTPGTPVEVSEPIIEEETAVELIAALTDEIKTLAAAGKIKKPHDKLLLALLKKAEWAAQELEKLSPPLTKKQELKKKSLTGFIPFYLKLFIEQVKLAEKKKWLDATVSNSLVEKTKIILGKVA